MSDFKIIGPSNPEVGKEIIYKISAVNFPANFPGQVNPFGNNPFTEQVKWSIYVLEYGKWILKEKNNKTGPTANYTFTEVSLKRQGIRIVALFGNEKATLDIKPLDTIERKIVKVELCDALGNLQTKPFGYNQTVLARVHCLNLDNCTVHVTLWEDDAPRAGHNEINKNNKAITKSELVANGIADVKFILAPNFAKMADAKVAAGDEKTGEGKTHEYYVTAEVFRQKTKSSNNINVINPNNKTVDKKTTPQKPVAEKPVKPKPTSPAAKKGPSKKEEKGIKESSSGTIYDWGEAGFKAITSILPDPMDIVNSVAKLFTPDKKDEKKDEKKGVCECEARVKAFMRMLRVGEGTEGEKGYTTAFNNNKIKDLSTHPKKDYGGSTAAGAYQIMRYTYAWLGGSKLEWTGKYFKILDIYEKEHDYIKKYSINDYKAESQDKLCICLMKDKKGMMELIIAGKIEDAIRKYGSSIWASLPHKGNNSRYEFKGKPQPATPMEECLSNYNAFFKEEMQNKSDLHLKKGFLKEFNYNCCKGEKEEKVSNSKCSCGKTHYDNAKPEHWIHQEPSECWAASVKILKNYGIEGGARTNCIIIANQKDEILTSIDAQKGIDYIDSQLKKGNPVVVGLDDNLRKTTYNVHKATDHFFVIVGSGCEDGKRFYNFFDVGSKTRDKGTDSSNRLIIKDNLLIQGKSNGGTHNYTITEIRRNN